MVYVLESRGRGTHILGHGREVPLWWPAFLRFSIRLGLYFIPPHNPIDPLFLQEKIGLSLSHLVPEILGPKVGVFFTKMYYSTDFKHFVSIFPSFSIQLTPFSINFKFLAPSVLQKLRSNWVQFFFRVLYPIQIQIQLQNVFIVLL